MTLPWRGTLLYTGSLAAIAVTVAARFAGASDVAAAPAPAPPVAPTSAPAAGPTSADGAPLSNGRDGTGNSDTVAPSPPPPVATPTPTVVTPAPAKPAPVQPAPAAPAPAAPAPAPAKPAPVTSTVVTGSSVQTRYGAVQVAVTFTGATVTAVQAVRYPGGNGTSDQINAYALPILATEAVAANSASIQTVSGASFTSQGYKQSLQSALDHRP